MKKHDIQERAFQFACRIVSLHKSLVRSGATERTLARQLLRSGTSVGALLEEAHAALDEFRHMRPGVGIAKLRSEALSTVPRYLKLRERLYDGLRLAGFEE